MEPHPLASVSGPFEDRRPSSAHSPLLWDLHRAKRPARVGETCCHPLGASVGAESRQEQEIPEAMMLPQLRRDPSALRVSAVSEITLKEP